jgi:hypothetical protein
MCDLEDVSERVAHHRSSVAIGSVEGSLHARRSGGERPPICLVGVVDIDVEKRREQLAFG